jgi:hypothetical protein
MSHEIQRPILHDFDYKELDRRDKEARGAAATGFPCPRCSAPHTRVVDSRAGEHDIRRRRKCKSCQHRFTTFERVGDGALPDDTAVVRTARRILLRLLAQLPLQAADGRTIGEIDLHTVRPRASAPQPEPADVPVPDAPSA